MNNAEGLEKRAGGAVHDPGDGGDDLMGGLGGSAAVHPLVPLNRRHGRCNAIPFSWFCDSMEDMATKSGPEAKIRCILTEWFREHLAGESPYPVVRLILPGNDCRTRYGIKEAKMAEIYVKALKLAKEGTAAQNILEWRTNKMSNLPEDLSEYIYSALKDRETGENSAKKHTIKDVNDVLDRLEKSRQHVTFRGGEQADKKDVKGETPDDIINMLKSSYPPMEQKWIVRIILGNNPTTGIKCGLSVTTLLSKLNPGSLQKYNECSDLRKAVEEWDSHNLEIGAPFKPMLSKFFPDNTKLGMIGTAEHAMRSGPGMAVQPFVMDKKIDGERLQYHFTRRKERFSLNPTTNEVNRFTTGRCFSKRGNEETGLFHALMVDLDRSIPSWVDKVILDGEVVCWDKLECAMVGFGTVLTQAKREGGQSDKRHVDMPGNQTNRLADDRDRYSLKFVVFDLVYLSGEGFSERVREGVQAIQQRLGIVLGPAQAAALQPGQVTHLPLALRRFLLSKAITETEARIEMCEHEEVVSGDKVVRCEALSRFFDRVIMRNEEGVVVKDLSSPYILGEASRTKQAPWVKLKPEYNDQVEDLDLVIIGGYVGEGKGLRGQGITSFLLACLLDAEGEGEDRRCSKGGRLYVPLCKVGSGVSYESLKQIRDKVTPYQVAFRASKAKSRGRPVYPDNLVNYAGLTCGAAPWSLKYDDVPDFLIPPEHSVVVTIKCGSLCEGDSFAGGISVRFPRLREDEGIRHDKTCTDIMSLSAVKALQQKGFLTLNQASEGRKRKQSGAPNTGKPAAKGTSLVDKSIFGVVHVAASVARESTVFSDLYFHVSDTFTFSKSCKQSMEGDVDCSREGMQRLLQVHGCRTAQVLATPMIGTIILIGQKGLNASMLNARKARQNDMLSYQWVLDCIRAQPVQLVEQQPMYFVGMSDATRDDMRARGYDILGDHSTAEGTAAQMRLLLDHMDLGEMEALVGPAAVDDPKPALKKKKTEAGRGGGDTAAQREEMQLVLAARAQERASIMSDAQRGLTLGWRQMAVMLNVEERVAVALPCNCLWHPGNLIYCDIYEGLGEATPSPGNKERKPLGKSSPWLRGIRARAAALGAAFSTHLHVGVTHVIVAPRSSSSQRAALRARREALRALPGHVYEKHWVGPAWLEDCLDAGECRPPEAKHRVDLS